MTALYKILLLSDNPKELHDIQIQFDLLLKRFEEQAKLAYPEVTINLNKESYETWN